MSDLDWMQDGLCRQVDPELFFVPKGWSTDPAKSICKACAVVGECAEYALGDTSLLGVWGAMSDRERKRVRASRGGQLPALRDAA